MESATEDKIPPEKSEGFFLDMKRLLSFELTWAERTTLEKAYTGLFIIMLIGLFPMPYDFYDSSRVFTCIALYFFFQVILPEHTSKPMWFSLIVGLFILYNPVIPIRIGDKPIWTLINIATLYALYRARLVFDNQPPSS